MSDAVTGGWAGVDAAYAAGAVFDAVSVCAQAAEIIRVRLRAVRDTFLWNFMEVQFSPFLFVLLLRLRRGRQLGVECHCGPTRTNFFAIGLFLYRKVAVFKYHYKHSRDYCKYKSA